MDVNDLTGDVLMDIIEKKNFIIMEDQSQLVSPPKSFDPGRWVQGHLLFCNYLKSIKGVDGVPLYYVVRGESPTNQELEKMNKEEILIHQVSHNGLAFEKVNRTTWLIIKNLLVDTVA